MNGTNIEHLASTNLTIGRLSIIITPVVVSTAHSNKNQAKFKQTFKDYIIPLHWFHTLYIKCVGDIAVDWIGNNLYWTDAFYGRIEVMDLDTGHHKVLINTSSSSYPWASGIAVDPRTRWDSAAHNVVWFPVYHACMQVCVLDWLGTWAKDRESIYGWAGQKSTTHGKSYTASWDHYWLQSSKNLLDWCALGQNWKLKFGWGWKDWARFGYFPTHVFNNWREYDLLDWLVPFIWSWNSCST